MTIKIIDIPVTSENESNLPFYGSEGAAGADVKANVTEDVVLKPGASCLVPTGLRMAIPEGYEIQVRPRSGLALKNQVTVLNTPGTIDSDYRGEVGIILINHGKEDFIIKPGMRIAQLVLSPFIRARFYQSDELAGTARGTNGFGHTGVH